MYMNSEMIIASITVGGCTGVLMSLVWEYTKYKNMRAGMLKTAEEYDVPYHQHETFVGAVRSHFSLLHQLGTGEYDRKLAIAKN